MSIESRQDLCDHLQTAIELEHSTLPPYLCALYSLKGGKNAEARDVLQSVAIEEMLHLTLAANILNAIGGKPVLDAPQLLPAHPTPLPHSDGSVMLSLQSFSRDAVAGFMAVERPGPIDAPSQDDAYTSIGQFYRAIDGALVGLSGRLGEAALFCGDPSRQVTDALYYGGGGRIIAVTDLASARRALAEIVEQGEGIDHETILDGDKDLFHAEREEIGHYFRFQQLLEGQAYARGDTPASGPSGEAITVDWTAVDEMEVDPKTADQPPGSSIREAMDAFNAAYCTVLQLLERTFNGAPDLLRPATGAMYGLKQQMLDLIAMRGGDGTSLSGPSFEWVAPERRRFESSRVTVLRDGPYLVRGKVEVFDAGEQLRRDGPICVLCRCGGSSTKPFCDGTHARIAFDGSERADHAPMAARRRAYPIEDGATIYDDRTRCAHFGQCTTRLAAAFGISDDAFVDPTAAPSADLADVVRGCPSGALTFAPIGTQDPAEDHQVPSIHPIVDGPYRVRGGVEVIGADGVPYDIRERQTLCRCGQSGNKPFCDGSHWYAGFRDPLPPEYDGAFPYPWTAKDAAERGRERYNREQAAKSAAASSS